MGEKNIYLWTEEWFGWVVSSLEGAILKDWRQKKKSYGEVYTQARVCGVFGGFSFLLMHTRKHPCRRDK